MAPFIVWTWITAQRQQLPLGNAFPALLTELAHVKDLFDAHGKIGGVVMLGSILVSLAMAVIMASRVPMMLYFDLLDRKVEAREGRVVAREEQINRPNGRDPIEKYFFSLRYLNMPVNLAAYRALEAGSIYILYLLPRSERSGLHRTQNGQTAALGPASLQEALTVFTGMTASPSPSKRAG